MNVHDRIAALRPTPLTEPVENSIAKLVQALVLDELATGRKVYPTRDWINFTIEGDRLASVKIDLRFKP